MNAPTIASLALEAFVVAEPVALPPNITRIETQAALYGYGVVQLGFVEVESEQEAIERAGDRDAFLLKSNVRPVWYLIFPHVIVRPAKIQP
jgi:hypothetical protein